MGTAKVDEEAATELSLEFAAIAVKAGLSNLETLSTCFQLSAAMLAAEPCDICRRALFEAMTTNLNRQMEAQAKEMVGMYERKCGHLDPIFAEHFF